MLFDAGVPSLSFLSFSAVLEAKTPCYEVTEEEFERQQCINCNLIVAKCIKLGMANRLTSLLTGSLNCQFLYLCH